MRPIILLVTLNTNQNPPVLEVSEKNGVNEVDRDPSQQVIEWHLAGNAKNGYFLDPKDTVAPGFKWLGTAPKAGIFSDAKQAPPWRLSLTDLNDSDSSANKYYYRLRALIDGVPYHSESVPAPADRPTDPAIINK